MLVTNTATPQRIEAFRAKARAELAESGAVASRVQYMAGMGTGGPTGALAVRLNGLFEEFPGLIFCANDAGFSEDDLSFLRQLPAVRRLDLEFAKNVAGLEAVAELTELKQLRLELARLTSFEFVRSLPQLEVLRLERPPKGLVRASVAPIADLPALRDLSIFGYRAGIGALAQCTSLERLHLKDIRVRRWDFLPPQPLQYVKYDRLEGPAGFDPVTIDAAEISIVRMAIGAEIAADKG